MQNVDVGKTRNFALIGHMADGKTSLGEALLHAAGATSEVGSVEEGTSVLDATPEEANETKKPWATISPDADITCTRLNFHHVGRVELLKDFDLTIPGGKVTALIGPSGVGKSVPNTVTESRSPTACSQATLVSRVAWRVL